MNAIFVVYTQFQLFLSCRQHQHLQSTENFSKGNDKEYYNDLPDKLPPDLMNEMDLHEQQQQSTQKVAQLNLKKPRDRLSSNLIDLNSPPPDQTTNKMNLCSFDPMKDNGGLIQQQQQPPDVFDIR